VAFEGSSGNSPLMMKSLIRSIQFFVPVVVVTAYMAALAFPLCWAALAFLV
ncbi:hypothetical protein A2U01_0054786, partial [Trifolium medium]|nr:hypothetical protein [Trifolium medium]